MTVEERRIAALESLVVYLIKESVRSSQGASSLLLSQDGQARRYPALLPEFREVADTSLVQARLEKLVDFALGRADLDPA